MECLNGGLLGLPVVEEADTGCIEVIGVVPLRFGEVGTSVRDDLARELHDARALGCVSGSTVGGMLLTAQHRFPGHRAYSPLKFV